MSVGGKDHTSVRNLRGLLWSMKIAAILFEHSDP